MLVRDHNIMCSFAFASAVQFAYSLVTLGIKYKLCSTCVYRGFPGMSPKHMGALTKVSVHLLKASLCY